MILANEAYMAACVDLYKYLNNEAIAVPVDVLARMVELPDYAIEGYIQKWLALDAAEEEADKAVDS